MKRLKKLIVLVLATLIAVPFAAVFGAQASAFLTIKNSGTYAVVQKCALGASGVIDIPFEYEGVPVTQIASSAFNGCNMITQVNIPSSVTKIGSNAFDGCTELNTVNFAGDECSIGAAAFRYCSALKNISLPSKLEAVSQEMFSYCTSLENFSVPSTIKHIGARAFESCTGITSVIVPASVKSIGNNAFLGCTAVSEFSVESGNSVYSSVDGALYGPFESPYDPDITNPITDKALIQYPSAKAVAEVSVASGTVIIANDAFIRNENIERVILPAGIKSIGDHAFFKCERLSQINIPSSVELIGSRAFAECPSLKSITVYGDLDDFAFADSGLTSVVISSGTEKIGIRCFENCTELESADIPESVATIGIGAFNGCAKVTLVVDGGSAAQSYAQSNSIKYRLRNEKVIESIAVRTLPNKTSYYYKESLNTEGLTLTVNYTDGSSETVSSGFEVSPSKLNSVGSKTITVTYAGHTAAFGVKVSYAWWQWIIRILLLGFLWY